MKNGSVSVTVSDGNSVIEIGPEKSPRLQRRSYHWRKARREAAVKKSMKAPLKDKGNSGAVLSEEHRGRIIAQALGSPAFAGMAEADVRTFVEGKLDEYLKNQPWWFGGTPSADTQHRAALRQYRSRVILPDGDATERSQGATESERSDAEAA